MLRLLLACSVLALLARPAAGLEAQAIEDLAFGDNDAKIAAIGTLLAEGDSAAARLLQAAADGELQVAGKQVLIVKDGKARDAATNAAVALPAAREDVILNNRVRRELGTALAALQLVSPDRNARLAAARALESGTESAMLPLIRKALERETDSEIRSALMLIEAATNLHSSDPETRIAAVRTLGKSTNPNTKTLLFTVFEKKDGRFIETDEGVRAEAERSIRTIDARLAWGERLGLLFSGVSLGSILLLAALGLAITYGLMGVINMAHGELIMIGAYATYVVQNLVRGHAPQFFDAYLALAVPASFLASAIVGVALERSVIRFLYGRPLETLLATWGISLILIQAVRTVFGAQNVQVENPVWMSGGLQVMANVVLPWNRVVIIGFAAGVLACVWLLLVRTRLGLFVRAVTQNRAMAGCVGVPTGRVDMWAFGLGAGLAGLAGCALSQIGNVGPDLGQAYIVDSFLVVVVGGVGQLAGAVYAALGLGFVNKFLESWSGAVLAKIAVLVFIIFFIQKRPQGLFALKGRTAE